MKHSYLYLIMALAAITITMSSCKVKKLSKQAQQYESAGMYQQAADCYLLAMKRKPDKTDIKPEHIEALQETADDQIAVMMAKGFTSGDLHDNIHMTDDDPEGGIDYSGWWDISTYVLDK